MRRKGSLRLITKGTIADADCKPEQVYDLIPETCSNAGLTPDVYCLNYINDNH